ncbi:hypothetical protein F4777DRAFT_550081 [Nemania sp. FL0916]|nr:hypothetical protein F4777DRAFT_550081 [Nemania sp. FL0916]
MADEGLLRKVRELGDVDLAALLCLISREHCIVSTDAEYLDDLTAELQLAASRTFGLDSAVVDCTPETTLDSFVAAIQLPPANNPRAPPTPRARGSESYFSPHHGGGGSSNSSGKGHSQWQQNQHGARRPPPSLSPDSHVNANASTTPASPSRVSLPSPAAQQQQQQIANVILARNLDTAPKVVQIQCLELMRTRRIFTGTAVRTCPKQFLVVAVLGSESAGAARLTKHLNSHFYISHWQDPEDGFPHLDAEGGRIGANQDDDADDTASQASSASVVRKTPSSKTSPTAVLTPMPAPGPGQHAISTTDWAIQDQATPQAATDNAHNGGSNNNTEHSHIFTETEISALSTLSLQTHVDIEVQRYLMNIIAFLRLHRAVTPGSVPPSATTHFRTLVRSLAALHGLDYVTPELVQLAARKIYAHHIVIVTPEQERSMQWGSDLDAVKTLLEDVQPEDVVEDVLGLVDVPL